MAIRELQDYQPEDRMPSDVKGIWLGALRSGLYRQGQSYLKLTSCDGPEYCCLGVLGEVACENGLEDERIQHHQDVLGEETLPPGMFNLSEETQAALAAANDDEGLTFEQIADWVEANL